MTKKLNWPAGVPEGWLSVEAYLNTANGRLVVLGDPDEGDPQEDGGHNCDAMGCSSLFHVAWRGQLPRRPMLEALRATPGLVAMLAVHFGKGA